MKKAALISCDDVFKKIVRAAADAEGAECVDAERGGELEPFDIVIADADAAEHDDIAFLSRALSLTSVIAAVSSDGDKKALDEMFAPSGLITVKRPISADLARLAIGLALTAGRSMFLLKKENAQLRTKLDDVKIMNRAKLCLVSRLNMSEAQAHKYILRRAMDSHTTARAVSEGILKTYEF